MNEKKDDHNFKLLFVEDVDDDVELSVISLRHEGFQISYDIVEDPEGFRKALSTTTYDAIICDYRMPKFTITEAHSILRELNKDIPFIILSGVIEENVAVQAMLDGADDFIMKNNQKRLGAAISREVKAADVRHKKRMSDENLIQSESRAQILAERLAEALKAKDDFIAIVSHELKTPLCALKLQTQMHLRNKESNKDAKEYAEQVHKHVKRLTNMVVEMLDANILRIGNFKLDLSETDISDLISKVLSNLAPIFSDYKVSPPLFIANPQAVLTMDKERIEQVLNILLLNSLEHGQGKEIFISIIENDSNIETIITDHGSENGSSNLDKKFERFGLGITNNEVSGLGLSLYVAKEIITTHAGRIWVQSETGKSASFHFSIPKNLA